MREANKEQEKLIEYVIAIKQNLDKQLYELKEEKKYDKKAVFTGYTLSPEETDGNPCIGAGNNNLCEERRQVCASRLWPLGTVIQIRDFGQCVILDRTSSKYGSRIDILFKGERAKEKAKAWGKKEVEYYLITPPPLNN